MAETHCFKAVFSVVLEEEGFFFLAAAPAPSALIPERME